MPNHHFACHTEPQLLDYGTVYDIWAFLGERLNKLLKDFNLNNWGGGQLEITMMRAFYRNAEARSLVCDLCGLSWYHVHSLTRHVFSCTIPQQPRRQKVVTHLRQSRNIF